MGWDGGAAPSSTLCGVSRHREGPERSLRSPVLWATGALVGTVALVGGIVVLSTVTDDSTRGTARVGVSLASAPPSATKPTKRETPLTQKLPPLKVQPGDVIRPQVGPVLVKASTGRVGSGLALGPLTGVEAPVTEPVKGTVTASVANLPNRTSDGGFASSLGTLTAGDQDFVILNEVSRRSIDGIRSIAPAYDAYRDPQADRSTGGTQSMNNIVMWRSDRWLLVDAGRIKVVDNDTGFLQGQAFTWDRYATWAMLQRKEDGAIVSVVSTHMPTNPGKFPQQHGRTSMSRIERYSRGMDILVSSVRVLAQHGPVLVGGDMNSHHSQGAWSAAGKMTAAGYQYVKDRGVMHLFFQGGADVVSSQQVGVASDHPGLVTTLNMNGLGPS
jgi:endonuclease/exonuclease/phosphatase family metal-dependent hydrolase